MTKAGYRLRVENPPALESEFVLTSEAVGESHHQTCSVNARITYCWLFTALLSMISKVRLKRAVPRSYNCLQNSNNSSNVKRPIHVGIQGFSRGLSLRSNLSLFLSYARKPPAVHQFCKSSKERSLL